MLLAWNLENISIVSRDDQILKDKKQFAFSFLSKMS